VALLALVLGTIQAPAQDAQAPAAAPADGVQWLEEKGETPYAVPGELKAGDKGLAVRLWLASGDAGKDGLAVEIKGGEARFLAARGGQFSPLGTPGKLPPVGEEPVEFSVQRHAWRLLFICGGHVVCKAWSYAPDGTAERVGWESLGAGQADDLRVQPVGEIFATDSFMRLDTGSGGWETGRGTWQQRSLREDQQAGAMDASKSTNPFSYFGQVGKSEGAAVTTIGYSFWTNYSIDAAVRAGQDSVIGVVVCYQDADNYLAAKWTSCVGASEPQTLKLVAVKDGEETVLAQERAGFLPDQWYRLGLGYSGGRLVCWVDGQKRVAGETDLFGQGSAGLLAGGSEGVFFDDVAIQDWSAEGDDFKVAQPGKWIPQSGTWEVSGGVMKATGKGEALALAGQPDWKNCRAGAGVKIGTEQAGILMGADGDAQVLAALHKAGQGDKLSILSKTRDGQWQEAAVMALGASAPWRRLEVAVEDGYVVASCNGAQARAFVPGAGMGRVGLLTRGGSAAFDDFAVEPIPPPPTAHLVKEFTDAQQHFEMAEWAATRHAWVPAATDLNLPDAEKPKAEGVWCTKGDYYGDYTVDVPLTGIGARDLDLAVALDSDPRWQGTGVTVRVAGKPGQKSLALTILNGTEQVAQQQVDVEAAQATLKCSRLGEFVVIEVDGKLVYSGKLLSPEGSKASAQ